MGSINSDFTENEINGISFWMVVDIVKGHKNIDLYKFESYSNQIVGIHRQQLFLKVAIRCIWVQKKNADTLLKYDY